MPNPPGIIIPGEDPQEDPQEHRAPTDVGGAAARASERLLIREIQEIQATRFSGPLPPPELLEHYERILPGFGQRMLEMAQTEGEHRRNLESRSLDAKIEAMRRGFDDSKRGQIFAFVIAAIFVVAGVIVVLCGHDVSGTLLGGVGVTGIVTAFIVGRQISRQIRKGQLSGNDLEEEEEQEQEEARTE